MKHFLVFLILVLLSPARLFAQPALDSWLRVTPSTQEREIFKAMEEQDSGNLLFLMFSYLNHAPFTKKSVLFQRSPAGVLLDSVSFPNVALSHLLINANYIYLFGNYGNVQHGGVCVVLLDHDLNVLRTDNLGMLSVPMEFRQAHFYEERLGVLIQHDSSGAGMFYAMTQDLNVEKQFNIHPSLGWGTIKDFLYQPLSHRFVLAGDSIVVTEELLQKRVRLIQVDTNFQEVAVRLANFFPMDYLALQRSAESISAYPTLLEKLDDTSFFLIAHAHVHPNIFDINVGNRQISISRWDADLNPLLHEIHGGYDTVETLGESSVSVSLHRQLLVGMISQKRIASGWLNDSCRIRINSFDHTGTKVHERYIAIPGHRLRIWQLKSLHDGSIGIVGYYYNFNAGKTHAAQDAIFIRIDSLGHVFNTHVSSLQKQGIRLYPNPSAGIYRISDADLVRSIGLTDLSGRSLKFGLEGDQLDLSLHPTGLYFATIHLKDGSRQCVKLIKEP